MKTMINFCIFTKSIPTMIVLFIYTVMLLPVYAEVPQKGKQISDTKDQFKLDIDYFWPIRKDRKIQTTIIDVLKKHDDYNTIHLSLYHGVVFNYAWGHIFQPDQFNQDVKYKNAAFGIGPMFLARWKPFKTNLLILSLDASGGIIFHDKKFPAGGDFYNFIWRIGPSIEYQIDSSQSFMLGFRLMHISNGQGITEGNPAYDAAGISLQIAKDF